MLGRFEIRSQVDEEGGNVTSEDLFDTAESFHRRRLLSESDKEQTLVRQTRTELSVQQEPLVNPNAYQPELMELCQVKASDFRLLGYEEVNGGTVWDCVKSRNKGDIPLYQMVDAILSLQIGTLMNHLTISAYKGEFFEEDV